MLSVLQIGAFPFPTWQGSQVYARGMVEGLVEVGHAVTLACYAAGEGEDPPGVRLARIPRVPGEGMASGPTPTRPLQDALLAARVAGLLRRERFDVIHAHNVEAPLAGALARVAARRRVPLVYNLHTALAEELPRWWPDGLRGRLALPLGRAVDALLPRLCDGCVALSEAAEEALRRNGARRVLRVPPGVRLAELEGGDAGRARQRWSLDGRPWVVYAGNTDAYQDLPDLYDAMARVPEAGLLLVTGADPAPEEAALDARGVGPERRRVVHSRAFADTLDALAAASVAALPRRQCAGFPIKLLNQLGVGVPTVAARGSAQPIAGVVTVPDGDPSAMAAALSRLIGDPDARRSLGEAGRAAIAADYTLAAQARRLADWYPTLR